MGKVIIDGEKVQLRQLSVEDVSDLYLSWLNDDEVTQYLEVRFEKTDMQKLKDFVKKCEKDSLLLGIFVKESGKHIGNIKIGPIERIHSRAHFGIMIGDRNSWGKGYATEALNLACRHAFTKMNLHKVFAGCYEPNMAAINLFLKCGFKEEGVLRNHFLCKNEYVDSRFFGLLKEEFLARSHR